MKKIFFFVVVLTQLLFSSSIFAQQSGGGGGDDLKGVCELAGGTWTGSEAGNWACCWDNWGCYGCYNGVCKMQCRTQRCRRANGMSRVNPQQQTVPGLAPKGMKAPVVPKSVMKLSQ